MLTSHPPGGAPSAINRQLPQGLSIPGQQQQAYAAQPTPYAGAPGLQPSGMASAQSMPTMLGTPPPGAIPGQTMMPPGIGSGVGGPTNTMMPGEGLPTNTMMTGAGGGVGNMPTNTQSGLADPQIQAYVNALAQPGMPTQTY